MDREAMEREAIERNVKTVVAESLEREGLPEFAFYAVRRIQSRLERVMGRASIPLRVCDGALATLLRRRGGLPEMEGRLVAAYAEWIAIHRPTERMPSRVRAGQILVYTGSALAAMEGRERAAGGDEVALPPAEMGKQEERAAWDLLEAAAKWGRAEA